jgi:hypothetical protein
VEVLTMKHKRELALTAGLVFLCILASGCGSGTPVGSGGNVDNTDFTAEQPFRAALEVVNQTMFALEGVTGEISLNAVDQPDSIVISGTVRVRSESTEDAEDHLELIEIQIEDLADEVSVETDQPAEPRGRIYEVDYEITLPESMDIDVVAVNAQIELDGIVGDAAVDLVNGQIAGDVTILEGGAIDIDLVNGSLLLSIPKTTSAEFSATVVNGSISISGLVLDDLESTPTSLTGKLGTGDGDISLDVVNGYIGVTGFD